MNLVPAIHQPAEVLNRLLKTRVLSLLETGEPCKERRTHPTPAGTSTNQPGEPCKERRTHPTPAATSTSNRVSLWTKSEASPALEPLGGAFWADILFVTTHARAELSSEESDALAKATAALGFNPMQSALLTDAASFDAQQLSAYVTALDPQTLVFLEATAVPSGNLLPQDTVPYCKVVVVTDFFASLDALPKKTQAWKELKQATKIPVLK
jgi:hypothetical protein